MTVLIVIAALFGYVAFGFATGAYINTMGDDWARSDRDLAVLYRDLAVLFGGFLWPVVVGIIIPIISVGERSAAIGTAIANFSIERERKRQKLRVEVQVAEKELDREFNDLDQSVGKRMV